MATVGGIVAWAEAETVRRGPRRYSVKRHTWKEALPILVVGTLCTCRAFLNYNRRDPPTDLFVRLTSTMIPASSRNSAWLDRFAPSILSDLSNGALLE